MPELTEWEARSAAEALAERVQIEGVDAAMGELDRALEEFRDSGHSIESILPPDDGKLGFSLVRARDGKSFWAIYAEVLRNRLCKTDGEFGKLARAGLSGSAGAIATAILTALSFPSAAFAVVVPMAAIVASGGIDAFCKFTEDGKLPANRATKKKSAKPRG
jgi:hypothetical protein